MTNEKKIRVEDYSNPKYLDYTIAVLRGRAIPYSCDGLKPVHRRILYAMNVMGIKAGSYKKSARIVGDVIGKYHPHGDGAVYESMVRMSQEWLMRYPIIDGQGNFGSRDGDGAAAMRYTESSLTKYAEDILMGELKEGTSDFIPNYDETLTEVQYLSSRLNNLLLNGSIGVAVSMATKIPSHNMRELTNATIAYINDNNISVEDMMEHLKGPDFASAAQIVSSKEQILKAYKTGQGIIKVRSVWNVEKLARGQWQVVVTEMPPEVDIVKVLTKIDTIMNPQSKKSGKDGKKEDLSAKVLQNKNFLQSILTKGKNDSDKNGDRLVLEPRSSKQDPEEFMNALIPMLELEVSFGINMVSIGADNRPEVKNIKQLISEWVSYRLLTLKRRLQFHLDKANRRIHILEGRIKAYNALDEVIKIIRTEDDPKSILIEKYGFTEIQADDVLDIKLRQLAKLELDNLKTELDKVSIESDRLQSLINSDKRLYTLMKKEIEADTVKFEDERRTLIQEEVPITATKSTKTVEENITVIYTKDGWLSMRKGHDFDLSGFALKQDDEVQVVEEMKSTDELCFLASNGRGYSIKAADIPHGRNPTHVNSLFELKGGTIVDVMFGKEDDVRLFSNDSGYGFLSSTSNLISKNKAGKHFMTVSDDTTIFRTEKFNKEAELTRLNVLTTDKRLLSFDINEVKQLDKGKGVQLVRLVGDNRILQLGISKNNEISILKGEATHIIKDEELAPYISSRARRGKSVKEDVRLF